MSASPGGAGREEERRLVPPAIADDAHKGQAGRVLCLVGSEKMPGAAVLVAKAAQRAGAGLVHVNCLDVTLAAALAVAAPEAVHVDLFERGSLVFALGEFRDDALLIGCGLGQGERARELVDAVIARNRAVPTVFDADALRLVGTEVERLRDVRGPLVLTPHPGEAAGLLGREVPPDPEGRIETARELALRSESICVLKGAGTVVTDGERVYVNDTGNAGMATAGSGDVLAGILVAYLALCADPPDAAWTPLDAACAAVRAHGLAGDVAASHAGRRGLIASDLVSWLPAAQKRLEG